MSRALLWGSPAMQSCCLWSALQITHLWDLAAHVGSRWHDGSLAFWNRAWEKLLALIKTWKRGHERTQRMSVSVTAAPEPVANPRYDGYYPQCRALWRVLNRLQWVGQIYNASLNAHTRTHHDRYLLSGGVSWLGGTSCRSGRLAKSSCSANPIARERTTIFPSLHQENDTQRESSKVQKVRVESERKHKEKPLVGSRYY